MTNHLKVYLEHFKLSPGETIYSEISGKKAVDIHHLFARKRGGDPKGDKDKIENLMALTRDEHELCENNTKYNDMAKIIHARYLQLNPYNNPDIFTDKIYEANLKAIKLCL